MSSCHMEPLLWTVQHSANSIRAMRARSTRVAGKPKAGSQSWSHAQQWSSEHRHLVNTAREEAVSISVPTEPSTVPGA